jgi:hypothetical protein
MVEPKPRATIPLDPDVSSSKTFDSEARLGIAFISGIISIKEV